VLGSVGEPINEEAWHWYHNHIGTVQSVPRLMPGQGVIVGVGSIDYPAEFQGSDETNLNALGVSKVVTVTSTYDHRIIQGAESGMFLKRVHELLLGEHGFYDDIFRSLEIPYQAVQWSSDVSPMNREETMMHKQMQVSLLVRSHRVRGHLIADIDPLRWKEPKLPRDLDPQHYGLTIWDLEREFLTGGVAGSSKMKLDELLGVLRDAYCRTIGVEYMHIQDTEEQRWLQSKLEGVTFTPTLDKKLRILERLKLLLLNGRVDHQHEHRELPFKSTCSNATVTLFMPVDSLPVIFEAFNPQLISSPIVTPPTSITINDFFECWHPPQLV
jgi:2-oxoglutarate dehydrogenase E1 component